MGLQGEASKQKANQLFESVQENWIMGYSGVQVKLSPTSTQDPGSDLDGEPIAKLHQSLKRDHTTFE